MKRKNSYSLTGNFVTGVLYFILFIAQFFLLYFVGRKVFQLFPATIFIAYTFQLVVAIFIVNNERHDPSYKLSFLASLIAIPIIGAVLYFISQKSMIRTRLQTVFLDTKRETQIYFHQDQKILSETKEIDPLVGNTYSYLWNQLHYPVYYNEETKYFPLGQDYYEQLLIELEKAETFIFLEFFIIQRGKMWDTIEEILIEKVKAGVEVRLLIDGTNMVAKVPLDFPKKLNEMGIETKVFKPIMPILSLYQNYRNHRKVVVIDNKVGFTGGVNLADEYINEVEIFGHWKDTGVMTKGKSTASYTISFLTMWETVSEEKEDFSKYLLQIPESEVEENKGTFICPYSDNPYGIFRVGKEVYNDIINQSREYLHICTPYLILDDETLSDLVHLARSGVDVKIITPHIPDKKMVFFVTRSYYKQLLLGGVKIYEYTPGFIHAKSFVSDDIKSVVGTINLDYRSLFLHFENANHFYDPHVAAQVEKDFQETLKECQEITLEMRLNLSIFHKSMGRILRIFAPLL